jgi:hypothetical protein
MSGPYCLPRVLEIVAPVANANIVDLHSVTSKNKTKHGIANYLD